MSKEQERFFSLARSYSDNFDKVVRVGDTVSFFKETDALCLGEGDDKDENYHIHNGISNAIGPVSTISRVSDKRNRIEVNTEIFKKASKDIRLVSLLWCYCKRNHGNVLLLDEDADKQALTLFFSKQKVKSMKTFIKDYLSIILRASTSSEYKKRRVEAVTSFFKKKK